MRYEKPEFLLTFTHHKAEEEADFSHISDGELAHRAQHGLVVLGSRVGHAGQFGLQGLSGGQLTHLHDITKTHPLLFGSCREVQMERGGKGKTGFIQMGKKKQQISRLHLYFAARQFYLNKRNILLIRC